MSVKETVTANTTTTAQTTTQTRRLTNLDARDGKQLSSLEEAVVRMHHGVSLKSDAKLPTNGINDQVMTDLLEREMNAFVATGRIDDLEDIPMTDRRPMNAQSSRIIDALKED